MFDVKQIIKITFVILSLMMVGVFLYTSHRLVTDLSTEEHNKMEVWAEATRRVASDQSSGDMGLILKIVQSNSSIPAIVVDEQGRVIQHSNVDPDDSLDSLQLARRFNEIIAKENRITINLTHADQYLYYEESTLLKRLNYYPYIQFSVMLLFLLVAFMALQSSKRAEENKVWVGLSKETAHQLGTPISSLMAWIELLDMQQVDPSLLHEIRKDVDRLSTIADRFSKIGSAPTLEQHDLNDIITAAAEYIKRRTSNKVLITTHPLATPALCYVSIPLMEWVIENLCKNAIDAMGGQGKIDLYITTDEDLYYIDIKDSGKGIARKNFKRVFYPGYTTKQRGWGLGLTLVKRIIEEYHNGKIFIKESEMGKGTTFRIKLT